MKLDASPAISQNNEGMTRLVIARNLNNTIVGPRKSLKNFSVLYGGRKAIIGMNSQL